MIEVLAIAAAALLVPWLLLALIGATYKRGYDEGARATATYYRQRAREIVTEAQALNAQTTSDPLAGGDGWSEAA